MLNTNNLIFLGGIQSNMWIKNGKQLSRNYKQGYRVFSSLGIAQTLVSQSMGGIGGYSGLYLIKNLNINQERK